MLADDMQPAFRQQEVDIGDPAVLRILDRDDRPVGAPFADRVDRVLETEAGQRQAGGIVFQRRAVPVAARRALERNRACRIGRSQGGHFLDQGERGGRVGMHGARP